MKLEEIKPIAEEVVRWLEPLMDRVQIAGSIRRKQPEYDAVRSPQEATDAER